MTRRVDKKVPVSHGNDEIRTHRLFKDMLRQAGKTEEHFFEVLTKKKKKPPNPKEKKPPPS